MGSPEFAVPSLRMLYEHGYSIVGVVTATDKLGGRGGKQLLESAVKKYALSVGLPILQPPNLKSKSFLYILKSLNADIQVVVAFRMLPQIVWSMPRYGTINLHGSLLPKYRGAAPINWAIINGETETGVTTFRLQHEIDTGQILLQSKTTIEEEDDFGIVYQRLMVMGAELVLKTISMVEDGTAEPRVQDDAHASHAPKIFHESCEMDFSKSPEALSNFVRGLSPHPLAWFELHDQEIKVIKAKAISSTHRFEPGYVDSDRKKMLQIACTGGYISILELKPEGKRVMSISEFLNGYHWPEL
ncbi:MAG: methionyl-tRNA formyltransferase [Saprospiraceae bacterium]|nr:methionyl-tRNA formyltransferase [Saprospiraceae bacterium]